MRSSNIRLLCYLVLIATGLWNYEALESVSQIIVKSVIMMCLTEMIIMVLLVMFSNDQNKTHPQSKLNPDELVDLIKKNEENTGNAHIVIGEYDSYVEEESNYKLIDINNGNKFLIPFSEAYKNKKDISIIIETNGGNVSSSDIIFRSLVDYPYGVTIYIVNYAFSAGAFITLACKKIFMSPWALLGPTDPQISCESENKDYRGSSKIYMDMMNDKNDKTLSERMYMTSVDAKIYHEENVSYIRESLGRNGYNDKQIESITDELCSGKYTHGKPFNSKMLRGIGLNIEDDIPDYVYEINDRARRFRN